jgi:hypothetical protein
MSTKFEIDQLEERIAPSTLAIAPTSVGVAVNDGASVGLPILGSVSVGVSANDSVSFGGLGVSLPSVTSLI